jgi:predicted metal-dependent hydrolase
MPTLYDDEFGSIVIRRSKLTRDIKLSLAPNGSLRISMPLYAPLFLAKRLINSSRASLRELRESQPAAELHDMMQIGKSHRLSIRSGNALTARYLKSERIIQLTMPSNESLTNPAVSYALSPVIIEALRREAKSYLPKRLAYLADSHGFSYKKVRFSHASTRWGSCSSNGTISLNIALMRLDFELIDYVLIHELCHTQEMNHSAKFWSLVEACDPVYKQHRKLLKAEQPVVL